jgi:hypothetical protein
MIPHPRSPPDCLYDSETAKQRPRFIMDYSVQRLLILLLVTDTSGLVPSHRQCLSVLLKEVYKHPITQPVETTEVTI